MWLNEIVSYAANYPFFLDQLGEFVFLYFLLNQAMKHAIIRNEIFLSSGKEL